jgi:hypothetical protein
MNPVHRRSLKADFYRHNFLFTRTLLILLGTISIFCLASCAEKDDVTLIRNLIKEGAALAEEQDISAMMELTTKDFLAQPGSRNRREVRKFIWLVFRKYGKFRILYPEPAIELASDNQSAAATVHFLIAKKEQTIPKLEKLYKDPQRWLEEVSENADLYRFNLKLLQKNGDWLVSITAVEPFRGFGFSQ